MYISILYPQSPYPRILLIPTHTSHHARLLPFTYPHILQSKLSTHHIINIHQHPTIQASHKLNHPRISPLMYITYNQSLDYTIQLSLHLTIHSTTNQTFHASHQPTIHASYHLYITNQLSTDSTN